LASWDQN